MDARWNEMNELDWIGLDWIERKGGAIDEIPKDGKIDNLNIYTHTHLLAGYFTCYQAFCLLPNFLPTIEHFTCRTFYLLLSILPAKHFTCYRTFCLLLNILPATEHFAC
jgi:hypothetical protein